MFSAVLVVLLSSFPEPSPQGMSDQGKETEPDLEVLHDTKKSIKYLGNIWKVRHLVVDTPIGGHVILYVFKNGKIVNPEGFEVRDDWRNLDLELQRWDLGFGFVHTPHGEIYLSLEEHAFAGTGKWTSIYALPRKGGPKLVWKSSYYEGGPVFRDMDGDGRCEWIFDDFNPYSLLSLPEHILAFKNSPNGQLQLWRSYPNVHDVRVRRFRHYYGREL